MKYFIKDGTFYQMSDRHWKKFCKEMAHGNDAILNAKMLEFDVKDITSWDREDYSKEVGMKEVPNDLLEQKKRSNVSTRRRS